MHEGTRRQTKPALACAIQTLLADRRVADVHVGDLCRQAGVSRQTFYYNFRDKYDLMAWIFDEMVVEFDVASMRSAGTAMMQRIYDHRIFYREALADRSQNSLHGYLQQYYIAKHTHLIRQVLGVDALPALLTFSIRIYCYGCVDVTAEWLRDEAEPAVPELKARLLHDSMPAPMKAVYGF